MKKVILLTVVFLTAFSVKQSFAQNNLVVFSEQGEQFYVVINGVRQNAKPETNVKVTGLMQPMVTTKIIFADGKTPDVDQKTYLMSGGNQVNGFEFVYALKQKKSDNSYKLAFRSQAEIAQAPPTQGQTVIVYSAVPPPVSTTESTTTTISTTTSGTVPTGNNASLGMNVPGMNINMNVNMNGNAMNSTTSTTTSTTTTTSSAVNGNPPHQEGEEMYVLPGYNGAHNCRWPMNPSDFESAKSSIKSKSFEDSKLTIAKQILGSNCMLSSQVKEVMMLFDFENTKLDFAKFAWGKTFDPGNYYKLNDAFQFESSIDDLNKYIDGRK